MPSIAVKKASVPPKRKRIEGKHNSPISLNLPKPKNEEIEEAENFFLDRLKENMELLANHSNNTSSVTTIEENTNVLETESKRKQVKNT